MNIIGLFWYLLPAYFSNMAPVFAAYFFGRKAYLLDFGKTLNGKRILGSHKTIRGLLSGIILGTLVFYLQKQVFLGFEILDYSTAPIWLGVLLSAGALIGDAVKSFFKRQFGVKPGKPFIPWDQIDYVIGALLFGSLIYFPGWSEAITLLLLSFILTIIVKKTGYFLGVNKEKW